MSKEHKKNVNLESTSVPKPRSRDRSKRKVLKPKKTRRINVLPQPQSGSCQKAPENISVINKMSIKMNEDTLSFTNNLDELKPFSVDYQLNEHDLHGLNVLYLCNRHDYDTKMDRNRFHSIRAIGNLLKKHGGKMYNFGNGWANYQNSITLKENLEREFPKVNFGLIIIYQGLKQGNPYIGISDIDICKCITFNEMNHQENVKKQLDTFNPDFVICHHSNEMKLYQAQYPYIRFYHIPHCAEHTVFKNMGLKKKYDFTLIGRLCPKVYPLRVRFIRILIELEKLGFKCNVHQHPGYVLTDADSERVINEYVQKINESKIVLTCSSCYHYLLSKYAEIPMCGSVIAGDLPKDRYDLQSCIVHIDNSMDDLTIARRLYHNLKKYEELSKRGEELARSNYTQEHYAVNLIKFYFKTISSKSDLPPKPKPLIMPKPITNIITKSDFIVKDVLDLRTVAVDRHCVWLEQDEIKVPYQYDGHITKHIEPLQEMYDLTSIAHEYTIFHEFAKTQLSPPVGKIVRFNIVIHKNGKIDRAGAYGFQMKNANKLPPGKFTIADVSNYPINGSAAALGDFLREGNVINGYLIDVRRSCFDMVKWTDNDTLFRIEGINFH